MNNSVVHHCTYSVNESHHSQYEHVLSEVIPVLHNHVVGDVPGQVGCICVLEPQPDGFL